MSPTRLLRVLVLALVPLLIAAPALAQDDEPVKVEVKTSRTKVAPGDTLAIAVILDHQPGWHTNTNEPVPTPAMVREKFEPIATKIAVTAPATVAQWPIQWPKPHEVPVALAGPVEPFGVFDGRAVAYIPIQVATTVKAGETINIDLVVSYQACDDRNCLFPTDLPITVSLPVVDLAEAAGAAVQDADFAGFDPAVFSTAPSGGTAAAAAKASKPVRFNIFGWDFEIDPAGAGFVLLLLVAAFGGLLLNFTPCVLPVVPLKIMGLSQAAGNPARCFYLGAVMSLGVVAFWMAIGGAIAFISGFTAISSLFQTPWFSLAVGVFILLMAIGMLGAFAVRLPQAVYMVNPSHETASGSFMFGIMTAVLSTPCTAPFMGSAAAWAATQAPATTMTTFGAIGVGMALPYLVLSAFPGLLSKMPRTGPASELVKQVMGLLMMAVAVFFLGAGLDPLLREPVDPPFRFHWWIIAAFVVAAMVWLVVRTFQITKRPAPRLAWSVFAVILGAAAVLTAREVTDRGPIPWIGYTPERLASRLSERKVVVLDFTAEWCLNCKALESGVLYRPEIVKLLTSDSVIPMKVDLTGNNIPGKAKLKELNWVGIPLLAIYGPGVTEPIKFDAYTPDMVLQAIQQASGGTIPDLALNAQASPESTPAPAR